MSRWAVRVIFVVILCALGFALWWFLVPNQEHLIRKRLAEVAQLASFSSRESPLVKLANAQQLANFCTSNAQIAVDIPGRMQQTFNGREEISQAALGARAVVSSVQVEFVDVNVTFGPDKQSAVVQLTARGKVQGEQLVQELKFTFKKVEGKWLIDRVETVKTLSDASLPPGAFAAFAPFA